MKVIVEAIHGLWTSLMEVELSKQKMALMQQQEECWATEQFFWQQKQLFKQQEEARKVAEHIFMQQEEACKEWEHIFYEWEWVQLNIREISKALGSGSNLLLKRDMEADSVILINRKKQLAERLNFT